MYKILVVKFVDIEENDGIERIKWLQAPNSLRTSNPFPEVQNLGIRIKVCKINPSLTFITTAADRHKFTTYNSLSNHTPLPLRFEERHELCTDVL